MATLGVLTVTVKARWSFEVVSCMCPREMTIYISTAQAPANRVSRRPLAQPSRHLGLSDRSRLDNYLRSCAEFLTKRSFIEILPRRPLTEILYKELLSRSCREILPTELRSLQGRPLMGASCQETFNRELAHRACYETSYREHVKRHCREIC